MTNFSQRPLRNILKPFDCLLADKGSLSCVLIGQNNIFVIFVYSSGFLMTQIIQLLVFHVLRFVKHSLGVFLEVVFETIPVPFT